MVDKLVVVENKCFSFHDILLIYVFKLYNSYIFQSFLIIIFSYISYPIRNVPM
jgi:hypothetical protein